MSQYICPRCQGEYHTDEDHACLNPGEIMRGPDVDDGATRLLPSNPPAVGGAQEGDAASAAAC